MIKQLVCEIGFDHPNIIYFACGIVTRFGQVLEKNGWMIYGAPISLLQDTKEEVRLAFEVLYRFLHNKKAWPNFRKRYPEVANSIISNSFYKALMIGISFIEKFVNDEDAEVCVEYAKYMKNKKSGLAFEFLKDKNNADRFIVMQKIIEENAKKFYKYLNLQGLFIKEDIFE